MNLIDYFEQRRPRTYMTEWHDRWVCVAVQRAYEERRNLIIEMPPRSGKSETSARQPAKAALSPLPLESTH